MINKRLLVKALLSHNDENSFYDKKLQLNLASKEGKAKFLKHICALSNSNPKNNAYIVVGIEDKVNGIVGVDFFDDSKLQNLINAYLDNPPLVLYENIPFPHLPEGKVVGLVTIRPIEQVTALRKNIWKYFGGMIFFREGSISMPKTVDIELKDSNSERVKIIEQHAQNNISLTLDGVVEFLQNHREELCPTYRVFKETFVVCWSGLQKKVKDKTYYSRVDIELINEQVKLFYSNLDEVEINVTEDCFILTEYVRLGLNDQVNYYPLEEVTITFKENGSYVLDTQLLFTPPQLDKRSLYHLFNANNRLLEKLKNKGRFTLKEESDLFNLCAIYMLCVFNEIPNAFEQLEQAKSFLKDRDTVLYQTYKDCQRILRKVKYN
ncbi:MAG: ATP-binding protein [Flavobacteriaceae bacterium]